MGNSIYHLDCNFEENPDLKSVFEYLLCGICCASFSAGGGGNFPLTELPYMLYHLDCNLEENPDLKSVFAYLLPGMCYGSISVERVSNFIYQNTTYGIPK